MKDENSPIWKIKDKFLSRIKDRTPISKLKKKTVNAVGGANNEYYSKGLWVLACFDFLFVAFRILGLWISPDERVGYLMLLRMGDMVLMGILLLLFSKRKVRTRHALPIAYVIVAIYIWLAFVRKGVIYDAFLSVEVMVLIYSIIVLRRCYQEGKNRKIMEARAPIELSLRIQQPSQLFHPMVISPHLEISSEITDAVDRFLANERELAPLELNFFCKTRISEHMQRNAIEALQEHYQDEQRRINLVLTRLMRRSIALLCISMSIMVLYARFNNILGQSVIWLTLGNMSGFFLWEIGNTHLRHMDAYHSLEQALVSKHAEINFVCV